MSTKIEWTQETWNPVTGCTKVSPGCKHCYAARMAPRLQAMGQEKYADGFAVRCHEKELERPGRWRNPRSVFVNSMGDLFHEEVPEAFIQRVFEAMRATPRHTFQVLTKRAERLAEMSPQITWPANVWMGVSVEDANCTDRIEHLLTTEASVKFLSVEPLLGPIPELPVAGIDWVIVGGESGPGARPMDPAWVSQLRDRCVRAGVPFFFKQWGGVNKKKSGRLLDGRTWDEVPPR
ncbi:MAG: phage Gp37/Gp68 family protein [Deferrisomatales bacterium]|nr:phage Gp37/Gp68 family protein [Deferrisomatales bacterium]